MRDVRKSTTGTQLKLLLWKFYLQKRKSWISTILEIGFPLYLVLMVKLIMSVDMFNWEIQTKPAVPKFPILLLDNASSMMIENWRQAPESIGFAPNNVESQKLAQATLVQLLGIEYKDRVMMFSDENALESSKDILSAGVLFPEKLYETRSTSEFTVVHRNVNDDAFDDYYDLKHSTKEERFLSAGLIALQAAVSEAILGCAELDGCPDLVIRVQKFPQASS